MTKFDRNNKSFINQQIEDSVNLPKVGVVSQVFEHADVEDDSNYEVNVNIDSGSSQEKRVPVHTPTSGTVAIPKVGDKVLIIYTGGRTNRPIAFGYGWSNEDRPPAGLAGMFRSEFESGSSPSGDGNLYINGFTKYDDAPSSTDKRELNPEEAFIQITKNRESENIDPSEKENLPAKIEMYDSPKNDESWISVEINKEDGSDSDATWGIKFNIKTGEWKIAGPKGFGITSDGEGNFVWHHKDINFNEVSGSMGPIDL